MASHRGLFTEQPAGDERGGAHTVLARDVQHCCHVPEGDEAALSSEMLPLLPDLPKHGLQLPGITGGTTFKYASSFVWAA